MMTDIYNFNYKNPQPIHFQPILPPQSFANVVEASYIDIHLPIPHQPFEDEDEIDAVEIYNAAYKHFETTDEEQKGEDKCEDTEKYLEYINVLKNIIADAKNQHFQQQQKLNEHKSKIDELMSRK